MCHQPVAIKSSPRSSLLLGIFLGLIGSLALFWGILRNEAQGHLWADNFDPVLLKWTVSWGYHILFEKFDALNFWNANSFYPHKNTLAYSDSLLSAQLFYAPLRALGVAQLPALYLTLAGYVVLGCALTQHALNRLGLFTPIEKLLITLCAHFTLSLTNFLGHYQLFGFQLAPSFFLFLYLYITRWQLRDLVWMLVVLSLGVCFSIYLAPMLCALAFILGAVFFIKAVFVLGPIALWKKTGIRCVIVIGLFAAFLYFIQLGAYYKMRKEFPEQSFSQSAEYSAGLMSIVSEVSKHSLWYGQSADYAYGDWESAYFPGYVLLLISGLFVLTLLWKGSAWGLARVRKAREISKPGKECSELSSLALFSSLLFGICLVFSWGPFLNANEEIKLPFYYAADILPGLRSIRAPGRFGALWGLSLGIFSVILIRSILLSDKLRTITAWLVFIFVAVESFPNFEVYPYRPSKQELYPKIAKVLPANSALLELPVARKDHFETLKNIMNQLNASTHHWAKLVVGYGGRTTELCSALIALDQKVQRGEGSVSQVIDFARNQHITYLLIHTDRYEPGIRATWQELDSLPGVKRLFSEQSSVLYEIED